ncbi:MAG: FAD-dependent oxidoreductase [bacterium]
MIDVLIVGQGIAGTMLGFSCMEAGLSFMILDDLKGSNASLAAAALVEPLSGKRWTLSHRADEFIPTAKKRYQEIQRLLNCSFIHDYPTYRILCDEDQKRFYEKRCQDPLFASYLGSFHSQLDSRIQSPLGSVAIRESFSLNSPLLLGKARAFFLAGNLLRNERVNYKALSLYNTHVCYGDIRAKYVVFCQGASLQNNPFFSFLDFRPSKGETLTLSIPDLPPLGNLSFEKWLIPVAAGLFHYGSTYDWPPFHSDITSANKTLLLAHLDRYMSCPYTIVDQRWGIRCNTQHPTPLCFQHPDEKRVFVLGALGSKGFMSAPFLSHSLAKTLQQRSF